jgi:hypothetical protein
VRDAGDPPHQRSEHTAVWLRHLAPCQGNA